MCFVANNKHQTTSPVNMPKPISIYTCFCNCQMDFGTCGSTLSFGFCAEYLHNSYYDIYIVVWASMLPIEIGVYAWNLKIAVCYSTDICCASCFVGTVGRWTGKGLFKPSNCKLARNADFNAWQLHVHNLRPRSKLGSQFISTRWVLFHFFLHDHQTETVDCLGFRKKSLMRIKVTGKKERIGDYL